MAIIFYYSNVFPCLKYPHSVLFIFQISLKTTIRPDVVGNGERGKLSSEAKASPIKIDITVNSSNPEEEANVANNRVALTIPVIVETDIILRG